MNLSVQFFDDVMVDLPQVAEYKVYNDGGHYIATMVSHKPNNKQRTSSKDEYFDNIDTGVCLFDFNHKPNMEVVTDVDIKQFKKEK